MLARRLYNPTEHCGTTPVQGTNGLSFSCATIRFFKNGYLRCLEDVECLSVTPASVGTVSARWLCPVQREEIGPSQGQVTEVLEVGLDTHWLRVLDAPQSG